MPERVSRLLGIARQAGSDRNLLRTHLAGDPAATDQLVRRPYGRRRLTEALRSATGPWPPLSADDLRRERAVAVLESMGTPVSRKLLRTLAAGDPHARLTREARAAGGRLK